MPRKGTLFDNLIGPRQHTGRTMAKGDPDLTPMLS